MPLPSAARPPRLPVVGITADLAPHPASGRLIASAALDYAQAVADAGGTPLLLPPVPSQAEPHLAAIDALVLTGGDDPRTEAFGHPTHPKAAPMHPQRQEYELRLLALLRPDTPALGICLGMQLMCLHAGGVMDQHLPETLPTAMDHWDREHAVEPAPGAPLLVRGRVLSKHRQAITDPGRLDVAARSHDGVIEAVRDPARHFYVGVQWHPERTADERLGRAIFQALVRAASL